MIISQQDRITVLSFLIVRDAEDYSILSKVFRLFDKQAVSDNTALGLTTTDHKNLSNKVEATPKASKVENRLQRTFKTNLTMK